MRPPSHDTPLSVIAADPALIDLASSAAKGGAIGARGISGSSASLTAAALGRRSKRPVILVVAHLDDADEAVDELAAAGVSASRFPALEILPGETGVSLDLFAERLSVLRRLLAPGQDKPEILLCPVQALMQSVPSPAHMDSLATTLRAGESRPMSALVRWLDEAGYRRSDSIEEPGDFAVRGGILDIFPPGGSAEQSNAPRSGGASTDSGGPVRLDFFGDTIESITEIDLETLGSARRLESVELVGAKADAAFGGDDGLNPLELFPRESLAIIVETLEVTEQARGYFERVTDGRGVFGPPAVFQLLRARFHAFMELSQFSGAGASIELPVRPLPEFARDAAAAIAELGAMASSHHVRVFCQNDGEHQRLGELLAEFAAGTRVESAVAYLHRGFVWGTESGAERAHAFVPYHELLHRYQTRRRIRRLRAGRAADTFLEVDPGDFVVHADHGIARFLGLRSMKPRAPKPTAERAAEELLASRPQSRPVGRKPGATGESAPRPPGAEEYLTLEFAAGAKLHVPVSQIDKVQKYVGGFRGAPPLSVLGGKRWQSQKDSVKESVKDLAAELLRVQAAREHLPGVRFPDDTGWQKEFEAEFPYEETEDQLAALGEIKKDMMRSRPMDRLLCGDVGYGKTELAIRAAFKAVEFGKQVAVLVPTTLLAEQHERTFRQRFAPYPFRVESLSRFKSRSDQNDILAAARKGQVDILIGTHRLLSKDVRFADLALVVVDEEQRFGVEHKNALLALRMTVDVLTLSATPIPRTLHMSMLGLRDISSLSTPPLDRRAVVTEVLPYNERRIKAAIERELSREGQVFFVHNRVHNIRSVADDVQRLAPDARIVIGHGQMPDDELEDVMRRFVNREADILVSTTIIESGIDIPTANTMIINAADRFGLAELHQLRGRVGRYKHRAYCYLLLPPDRPVTDVAVRRLRAIEEFSMLGAGFKIAMRDLEIRGAGNLLGAEQSGHIAVVGYDMYCRLLDQAAQELRNQRTHEPAETSVEIGVGGSLPKAYIPSDARRLEAYRRIAGARTTEQVGAVEADLIAAYGPPPPGAALALELARLRVGAAKLGVRSIALHEQDIIFRTPDPAPLLEAMKDAKGSLRTIAPPPGDAKAAPADQGPAIQEVYYRPPANFLEPQTLLTLLRRRLAPESSDRATTPPAPVIPAAQPRQTSPRPAARR